MCLKNVLCFPNFYGLNFVCLSLTVLIFFVSSTLNFPKSLVNSKLPDPRKFILLFFLRYFDQDFSLPFSLKYFIISVEDFEKKPK